MIHETSSEKVGDLLRTWRKQRRLSQMDLAADVNVSTRHLSFVETGRANPSSDLILDLAAALRLPLRHVNSLLVAAGYAPRYSAWTLDDDRSGQVRAALQRMLDQHEPYPVVVTNRAYDFVMANRSFAALGQWLCGDDRMMQQFDNLYRMVFSAEGLQPYFADWPVLRDSLLDRLREESITYQNRDLAALYAECVAMSGGEPPTASSSSFPSQLPVLTFTLKKGDVELSLFSTMTTFGTAIDVTVQELRIESHYPADDATRRFFEAWVAKAR